MSNTRNDWKTVGTIGVDAGLCWIGDPCYILGGEAPLDYNTLLDKLDYTKEVNAVDNLGFAVSTGYGDGEYPVQVKYNKEGRVAEVRVVFIGDENDG